MDEGYMTAKELAEFDKRLREADLQSLDDYKKGLADAPVLFKGEGRVLSVDDGKPMVFIASEESEDRFGDVIEVGGWDIEGFKNNPVFLFVHDRLTPPVGMVPRIWTEGKQLLNTVRWDEADPFAQYLMGKYQRGFMRAVSVGFRALEFADGKPREGKDRVGLVFKKTELLEISAVPVPAHPKALQKAFAARKFAITMPDLSKTVTNFNLWAPYDLAGNAIITIPNVWVDPLQVKTNDARLERILTGINDEIDAETRQDSVKDMIKVAIEHVHAAMEIMDDMMERLKAGPGILKKDLPPDDDDQDEDEAKAESYTPVLSALEEAKAFFTPREKGGT